MQGVVHRPDDTLAAGLDAERAIRRLAASPDRIMVNRNPGAGTRILLDRLLAGARPPGYSNQPRSHNAVAAAVAQGRADWGVAIRPVAEARGLAFLPLVAEEYDFAVSASPRRPELVAAFAAALRAAAGAVSALGFEPVTPEGEA
jgi:putative molybdopterin biosynthesis protein